MWPFRSKANFEDWENFISSNEKTRKQFLLEECQNFGVSPYIDDKSEISSGIYAHLRGVASEAELERRLVAKRAGLQAKRSNLIAVASFIVSFVSLIVAIYAIK